MDLGLKNKKALIVGASKNIGAATARSLVDEGCKVFLVARDEVRLNELCATLGGEKAGHAYRAADLRTEAAPAKAAEQALVWAGAEGVDIVIHCTGGALGRKEILAPLNDWQDVWLFNAGIAIEMNRLLIPPMQRKKWGRVVHVSSIVGELGEPPGIFGGALPYEAAKAYLNAYVKGLGRSLAGDNVVVSAVMPGAVLSEGKFWDKMLKQDPAGVKKYIDDVYPAGRLGKPEEIASFITLLASERAAFAAGALIPISGGRV